MSKDFTKEDVKDAYRCVLGREPESDTVIQNHFDTHASLAELLKAIYLSPENQSRINSQGHNAAKSKQEADRGSHMVSTLNRYIREQVAAKIFSQARKYSPGKVLIRSFAEYDEFIQKYLSCSDHGASLKILRNYELDDETFLQRFGFKSIADPFSPEYKSQELAYFEFLSGRKHSYKNEGLPIDVDHMLQNLPPYIHGYESTAAYYQAMMNLLQVMKPVPGEHILEMGAGLGGLTELFARLKCNVSVIEANDSCCELIAQRCQRTSPVPEIFCESFNFAQNIDRVFDHIVFEASFHHSEDPLGLLRVLAAKASAQCKLVLFNEPIADFLRPWGVVRNDGESILQIRHKGWIEYGFREDFLTELLHKAGWVTVQKHSFSTTNPIYIAMKA